MTSSTVQRVFILIAWQAQLERLQITSKKDGYRLPSGTTTWLAGPRILTT